MLEKITSNPDGARSKPGLDEENGEADGDRDHRQDEQDRDRQTEPGFDEIGSEQQRHDDAGEDCRNDRETNRAADQPHPAVNDLKLAEPAIMLEAAAFEQQRLDASRAVDNAR